MPKLLSTGCSELTPIRTIRFSSSILSALDKSIVLYLIFSSIDLSSSSSCHEFSDSTESSTSTLSTSSCLLNSITTLSSSSVTFRMCLSSFNIAFSSFVNKGCFPISLSDLKPLVFSSIASSNSIGSNSCSFSQSLASSAVYLSASNLMACNSDSPSLIP